MTTEPSLRPLPTVGYRWGPNQTLKPSQHSCPAVGPMASLIRKPGLRPHPTRTVQPASSPSLGASPRPYPSWSDCRAPPTALPCSGVQPELCLGTQPATSLDQGGLQSPGSGLAQPGTPIESPTTCLWMLPADPSQTQNRANWRMSFPAETNL